MSAEIAAWLKMATTFFTVMFGAHHTTSWTEGNWNRGNERRGGFFLYFTIDEEQGKKARAALESAGVLCHEVLDGPRSYSVPLPKP